MKTPITKLDQTGQPLLTRRARVLRPPRPPDRSGLGARSEGCLPDSSPGESLGRSPRRAGGVEVHTPCRGWSDSWVRPARPKRWSFPAGSETNEAGCGMLPNSMSAMPVASPFGRAPLAAIKVKREVIYLQATRQAIYIYMHSYTVDGHR